MAIIKQTDIPTIGANVYADIDDLEDHAELRNVDISAFSFQQKEAALFIAAQDWVDGLHSFKGELVEPDQSMKLPTNEVSINNDIVTANCMTAMQQLTGLLFVEATANSNLGEIKMTRSKLDKLEKEIEYTEGSSKVIGSTYDTSKATAKLRPYLLNGGGISLLRV